MVISCTHEEAEGYREKSCNFPSPFEVELSSITVCLYGQEFCLCVLALECQTGW